MTEIDNLKSIINDLTLALEMWIDGYPFDEDHIAKQKLLIYEACSAIGKPRNLYELIKMCNIEDKIEPAILEELKKQYGENFK